jgi:membrane fusion protein (multidrug efflux system)
VTDTTHSTPADAPNAAGQTRRRGFLIFGVLLLVAAIAWAVYWFVRLRHYETTDDAYVAGDVVQITSEVPGTVTSVRIDDTQTVRRGDTLVELDPADARIAVASAEAELARAARDVSALFAQDAQLRAELSEREVTLARSARDYERRLPLLADGAVSSEELAHAKEAVDELRDAVSAARAQHATLAAQIDGTTVASHPRVLAAAASLRTAGLALRRTQIAAPVTGVVARRSVQIGERVAPGAPLLAVVPLDGVWIDANFKEVQLRRIRVGQPVTVHADIYDSDIEYHGKVVGLAAGSGSAFALLPAQNASGNWIKIVQRVPVRILLDPAEVKSHPLRLGLSTVVRVDVADASGPLVAGDVRGGARPPTAVTAEDPAIDARIAEIIARSSHGPRVSGVRPAP